MKNTTQHDPFKNLRLDAEEQVLEAAFEKGEYEEAHNLEDTKEMLKEAKTDVSS